MSRYEVIRELGRGGMGVVYEARMLLPMGEEMRVALKRINALGSEQMELFTHEALMSLHINNNHPNLITTHTFDVSEHGPCLVMEFVDGVSLCTLAASGRVEYAHIRRIARDTLRALAHVHAHGVVHRDVSPGNILISREGMVKLADLGLARAMDVADSGDFRGTTAYASPEALQGVKFDARSDLYSLGVVLYELITRTLPYGSGEPTRVFGIMTAGPPAPLPENTPVDLARMITGMMALDPDERAFVSATGALAFLDAHGEPVADDAELGALVESCMGTRPRSETKDREGSKRGKGDARPGLEMDSRDALPQEQPWSWVALALVVLLVAGLGVLGGIMAVECSGSARPGQPLAGAAQGALDERSAVERSPAAPAPFAAPELPSAAPAPGPVEDAPAPAGHGALPCACPPR